MCAQNLPEKFHALSTAPRNIVAVSYFPEHFFNCRDLSTAFSVGAVLACGREILRFHGVATAMVPTAWRGARPAEFLSSTPFRQPQSAFGVEWLANTRQTLSLIHI